MTKVGRKKKKQDGKKTAVGTRCPGHPRAATWVLHRTNYMGGENLPQPLGGATSELSERGGKLTRESSLGAKSLDSMRQAPRYAEKGSVPGRAETANVGIWHSCAPCSRGQPLRKSNASEFLLRSGLPYLLTYGT